MLILPLAAAACSGDGPLRSVDVGKALPSGEREATPIDPPPVPATCYPQRVAPAREGEPLSVVVLERDAIIASKNDRQASCVEELERTNARYRGETGGGK